jgi:hypothetical protein
MSAKSEKAIDETLETSGGEDGRDLGDWLAAEKELTELPEQANPGAPKVRAAAVGRVAQATP